MILSALFERTIKTGRVTLIDRAGKVRKFGPGGGPEIVLRLNTHEPILKPLFDPALWFGEAYMNGEVTIVQGTLYEFLDLCTRAPDAVNDHPLIRLKTWIGWPLRYLHQFNPPGRAHRNVQHHYDLSGALYELFLNDERDYSCAYFVTGNETLEEAQCEKKRRIATKLRLSPGQRVLDIGSGWGGLAFSLARDHGVAVTGLTLSHEQADFARRRAMEQGLDGATRFLLQDYRAESGIYDRVVSVGMFEHVGVAHYDTFFNKVRELLAADGVALLHSIGRMEPPGGTSAWLRKYIFPGGYSPALSEVLAAIERSGLWVTDIEILRLHYADTLRAWSTRFQANRARARELYDERFCRMWEFYLAVCEIVFRNGTQMVFQIQLTRDKNAVPRTRDYMADRTARRRGDPRRMGPLTTPAKTRIRGINLP